MRCDNCCIYTALFSGWVLSLGLLIYLPREFVVYYPYFNKSWKSSSCIVKSIKRFHMYSYEDTDEHKFYYNYYSLFDLEVNIDGDWKQGFACGCDDATMDIGAKGLNERFPYQYSACYKDNECGNMFVMPPWYCNECKNYTRYINKGMQDCKYLLIKGNDLISNAKEIPSGYRLDYPTEHSTFIQTILMGSPYYSKPDYLACQIILLGLMISLPAFLLIIALIYFLIAKIRGRISIDIYI